MATAANGLIKNAILPRVRNALTVYDTAAPALRPAYAKAKSKRAPPAVRNWTYTGRTLRSMKTLSSKENQAVIGFTDRESNMRAAINNARIRQFGVSPSDRRQLAREFSVVGPFVRAVQL